MTTAEQSATLARSVGDIGGRFMMDPAGFARAGEIGLDPGLGLYVVGRFGVLGRVDADVVAASAAFFAPATIREAWEPVASVRDPMEVATWYAGLCADYGRTHLADAGSAELDRWCALAERAVAAASPVGAPIFAGWRALPLPDDAPARAYQLVHLLRELRFGLHVHAVLAAGLHPLVTMLTTRGAAPMIEMFGWPAPHPEVTEDQRSLRAEVESLTDHLSAVSLAAWSSPEADEATTLLASLFADRSA